MITDAKAKPQGLTAFDYGGVAPDDQPDHPWAGATRFKKSPGGGGGDIHGYVGNHAQIGEIHGLPLGAHGTPDVTCATSDECHS